MKQVTTALPLIAMFFSSTIALAAPLTFPQGTATPSERCEVVADFETG